MGLLTGNSGARSAPWLPLQQLCRSWHSAEEVGFQPLTRGGEPSFNNKHYSETTKKTFLGMHESQAYIYFRRQASEGLGKKLPVIMASS